MMRMVPDAEWDLSRLSDPRRRTRLLAPLSPADLIAAVIREAACAADAGLVRLKWERADDSRAPKGCFRTVALIPISESTFDELFNGRAGYRAQFYLSPEEGVLFNRQIVDGLVRSVQTAYGQHPLDECWSVVERSLRAPHAKIWVFEEQEAFGEAEPYTLNPPRWEENEACFGRRAPLPAHRTIDVKGAFIHPRMDSLWVAEEKLERPCDIHRKGYA